MKKINLLFGFFLIVVSFVYLSGERFGTKLASSTLLAAYSCGYYTDSASCSDAGCLWGYNGSSMMYCYSKASSVPTMTPAPVCDSSHCYNCNQSTCGSGNDCLWGYNGSSMMYCYSKASAIPTATPTPVCDASHCGNCGTLTLCNAISNCSWSYSGGFCENTGCSMGGNVFPIGTRKCGVFGSSELYRCTAGGWVLVEDCDNRTNTSEQSCMNTGTVDNPADSGCSSDERCTSIGGFCTSDSVCSIGGQTGMFVSNLCLSSANYDYGRCCLPASSTCSGKFPGSTCAPSSVCPSNLQYGTVASCSSGYTCCGTSDTIVCDNSGFRSCGGCEECVNPGTVLSRCESTRTTGGSGAVGGANGGKYATMPTSGLCSSSYGTTVTDSVGSDGTFNWTCEGQSSSGCRSAGSNDYGSATKCTNQPVVNGACVSAASLANVTNHSLCVRGDEANVTVTEEKITWDCMGSTNTCAEGDGTDALNCYSYVDQSNWFQVNNGDILAKGKVTNYVPVTCTGNGNNCTAVTVKNGAVYSKSNSSVSSFDQSSYTSESSFSFKTFPYNQLKSDYFDKKGVGTTFAGSTDWSNIKDTAGVIFVDGDLEINSDLSTSSFVMIIAKGTITIDPNVNLFNGILVANKVVAAAADTASTTAVDQLVINGMVHGVSSVQFARSLYPKSLNNTTPSVVVNYNSELLFMIPEALNKSFSQWKVN